MSRRVVWFSCGAPSAIAAKLTLAQYPDAKVVYTYVEEEHPDNQRFIIDCERWLGVPIRAIGNEEYKCSIYEVFERQQYLCGHNGAPCTRLLKRQVREMYQRPDDIHIMGFTADEEDRVFDFLQAFPDLRIECPCMETRTG